MRNTCLLTFMDFELQNTLNQELFMCNKYWLEWKQPLLTDMLPPWIQKAFLELKKITYLLAEINHCRKVINLPFVKEK